MIKKLTSLLVVFSMMTSTIHPLWAMEEVVEMGEPEQGYTLMNDSCFSKGCGKAWKVVTLPSAVLFELLYDLGSPGIEKGVKAFSLAATGNPKSVKYFQGAFSVITGGIALVLVPMTLAALHGVENAEVKIGTNFTVDESLLASIRASTNTAVNLGVSSPFSGIKYFSFQLPIGLDNRTLSVDPEFSGAVEMSIPFGQGLRVIFPKEFDIALALYSCGYCASKIFDSALQAHKNNPNRRKPIQQALAGFKETFHNLCGCKKSTQSDPNSLFKKFIHNPIARAGATTVFLGSWWGFVYVLTGKEVGKAGFEYTGNFTEQDNYTDDYVGQEQKNVMESFPGGELIIDSQSNFSGYLNASSLLNATTYVALFGIASGASFALPLCITGLCVSGLFLVVGNLTSLEEKNNSEKIEDDSSIKANIDLDEEKTQKQIQVVTQTL